MCVLFLFTVPMRMAAKRQCQWLNNVAVASDARKIPNRPIFICHAKSFICAHWSKHLNAWVAVNSFVVHKRTISTMSFVKMLHFSCQRMPHSPNLLSNFWNRYVCLLFRKSFWIGFSIKIGLISYRILLFCLDQGHDEQPKLLALQPNRSSWVTSYRKS